jgi:plasmid stabilization system protein ParE
LTAVVVTASAEADLESIGDHIAQDDPLRALSFVRELRQACLLLADAPLAFPAVPRFEGAGIRRKVHGNYLIFYRIRTDIEILHVLHGAMDYERIIFPGR